MAGTPEAHRVLERATSASAATVAAALPAEKRVPGLMAEPATGAGVDTHRAVQGAVPDIVTQLQEQVRCACSVLLAVQAVTAIGFAGGTALQHVFQLHGRHSLGGATGESPALCQTVPSLPGDSLRRAARSRLPGSPCACHPEL